MKSNVIWLIWSKARGEMQYEAQFIWNNTMWDDVKE